MLIELRDSASTRIKIAETGNSLRGYSESIGISHAYLSQILNNKRNPSATVGHKIAKGLNLDIEDIFLIKTVDEVTGSGS